MPLLVSLFRGHRWADAKARVVAACRV